MENKILLVDDEEGIRTVLGIALADNGYRVFAAENGAQALEVFREHAPPIVLTDIKMPGMDGITLLKTIKKESPDTEVIMITGHGDLDLAIKSLQHQAIDFVTKPINDDVLEIALNRATDKIAMREQLRAYTQNLENLVKEQAAKLVEAERLLAVGQTVEGLSTAIKGIAGDLQTGIRYFNDMPCFVSIHDRGLNIVETNQLFIERLGRKVGRPSAEIYADPPDTTQPCPVAETFKSGVGQSARRTIHFKNGSELPVIIHTAPIRGKDGQLELVLELAADISEVNRLKGELRSTQRRYQELFDAVPCYISVQDRNFKLLATNRLFKEHFGERQGSRCYQAYKRRREPCADCPVQKTFQDGKSHHSEMVVTSAKGDRYNVLIWTSPIRDASGEVVQVMEMLTDITRIRQLQGHLSSLGFLISSISHGIKGLLTGLDGGMYMINKGVAEENRAKIKDGWGMVNLMSDRIRSMMQNILYYAKERDPDIEKVAVRGFAEDVCLTVEQKLHQAGITLTKELGPSLGHFKIDPGAVRSALINILENAVEAVSEKSTGTTPHIFFGVNRNGQEIVFTIEDNGIGMDRETLDNIFTLFFSTKGHSGTGLGLFIAHKAIEQHGGAIEAHSTPGKGSCFKVTLPVASSSGAQTSRVPAPA